MQDYLRASHHHYKKEFQSPHIKNTQFLPHPPIHTYYPPGHVFTCPIHSIKWGPIRDGNNPTNELPHCSTQSSIYNTTKFAATPTVHTSISSKSSTTKFPATFFTIPTAKPNRIFSHGRLFSDTTNPYEHLSRFSS